MKVKLDSNAPTNKIHIKLKKPAYTIDSKDHKKIEFLEKCEDEIIGIIEIQRDINNQLNLQFIRRNDYKSVFISLDDHDLYFNSQNTIVSTKSGNIKKIPKYNIQGRVAMVLESPHQDEFNIQNLVDNNGNIINARPANGKTGDNIDNHFKSTSQIDIINMLQAVNINPLMLLIGDTVQLSLALINAVQYQCSLGVNPKEFRDEVFLKVFSKKKTRKNLKYRIKKYSPDLLINSCTKGNTATKSEKNKGIKTITKDRVKKYFLSKYPKLKKYLKGYRGELREIVRKEIEPVVKNLKHTSHPSSKNFWNKNGEIIFK